MQVLVSALMRSEDLFPLDFSFFPLPTTFGYLRSHRNAHAARKCALNSRNAFVPLMAMVSYLIALWGKQSSQVDDPAWAKHLLKATTIHPEMG